jgi:hypothetical protein
VAGGQVLLSQASAAVPCHFRALWVQETIQVQRNGTAVVTLRRDREPQLYVLNPDEPATFGPVNQVKIRRRFDFTHGLAAFLTAWAVAAVLAALLTATMRGYIPVASFRTLPRWYAHGQGKWRGGAMNPSSSGNLTSHTATTSSGYLASKWLGQRQASSGQLADDVAVPMGRAMSSGGCAGKVPGEHVHGLPKQQVRQSSLSRFAAVKNNTKGAAAASPGTTFGAVAGMLDPQGEVEMQAPGATEVPMTSSIYADTGSTHQGGYAAAASTAGGRADDMFPAQRQHWTFLPQQSVRMLAPAGPEHIDEPQLSSAGGSPQHPGALAAHISGAQSAFTPG